ncbi:nuclear transport factor 2 family protein [Haloarcula nitratireducens]|uniref:Nuclear transport factor 2 family protein n=1 Tax=Haloarcula nitratireducens TaxID=2487749 RepID=A0AAW4PAP2_9EURY|nr:nuclear transport factor 2 family protein [Halomicroarcula nitratireducens]MBX0294828.1 nuclear transport factor 2 family protein [Halomicroarcula nitratireducens]
MDATTTVRDYYDSLRHGAPLDTFFADDRPEDDAISKVGISERLVGSDAVQAGLRDQTLSTSDWVVDSHALRVTERGDVAWFSDDVALAWTDEDGERHEFDTRWSGTLERRDGDWRFVGMHVSAPSKL